MKVIEQWEVTENDSNRPIFDMARQYQLICKKGSILCEEIEEINLEVQMISTKLRNKIRKSLEIDLSQGNELALDLDELSNEKIVVDKVEINEDSMNDIIRRVMNNG